MTRPTTRPPERVCCRIAADGIELLEAAFEHHVYDRHMHDCYAVGITLRGVQRFWCRGATHDSIPGDAIVINPGEAHDGRSGAAGGYAYRIMYIPIDVWSGVFADVLQRPGAGANVRSPLLHDRRLARELDAAWMAMADGAPLADELLARCLIRLAAHDGGRPSRLVSVFRCTPTISTCASMRRSGGSRAESPWRRSPPTWDSPIKATSADASGGRSV
jgi:AraC-like protein